MARDSKDRFEVSRFQALKDFDRAKVRILRFKNLPPFRNSRGLQNHV